MATSHLSFDDKIASYFRTIAARETDVLRRLREETALLPNSMMQVSPEHGQFLTFLTEFAGFRRTVEIGVFTGYSSLCVATALPEDGRMVAFDISPEYTSVARRYWREAGVDGKIDLRLGAAVENLPALVAAESGNCDFVFIDADKGAYDSYYESALALLKSGGLVALDNVLRGGRVADETATESDVISMRALNSKIHADARVTPAVLPYGDGLTLARKR